MADIATVTSTTGQSLYDRFFQGSNIRDFISTGTVAVSGANAAHCGIARSEIGSTGVYAAPDLSTLAAGLWVRQVCVKVNAGASFALSDVVIAQDGAFDWDGSSETRISGIPQAMDTQSEGLSQIEITQDEINAKLGTPAGASIAADVAAVKTDTAAVKAKTDNLPADPASNTHVDSAIAARPNVRVNASAS